MQTTSPYINELEQIRQSLDHPDANQELIIQQISQVFAKSGYTRRPYVFRFPAVFRAASKADEFWFNQSDDRTPNVNKLHCPPDDKATLGRCNWAGDPVFYCSSDNGVTIFEVRAAPKETVVVSTWVDGRNSDENIDRLLATNETPYPITVHGIAIGVRKLVESMQDGDPEKQLLLNDDIFNPTTSEAVKEIDEYVGELFTKSTVEVNNLYLFTSAIARIMLNNMKGVQTETKLDVLIYPSVASQFSGHNIAFNKDFARQRLKLLGAAMFRVVDYNEDRLNYELEPLKSLMTDPATFNPIWKNIHPKNASQHWMLSPDIEAVAPDNNYLELED